MGFNFFGQKEDLTIAYALVKWNDGRAIILEEESFTWANPIDATTSYSNEEDITEELPAYEIEESLPYEDYAIMLPSREREGSLPSALGRDP